MKADFKFVRYHDGVTSFAWVTVVVEKAPTISVVWTATAVAVQSYYGDPIESGINDALMAHTKAGGTPVCVQIVSLVQAPADTRPDAVRCSAALATWKALGRDAALVRVERVAGEWIASFSAAALDTSDVAQRKPSPSHQPFTGVRAFGGRRYRGTSGQLRRHLLERLGVGPLDLIIKKCIDVQVQLDKAAGEYLVSWAKAQFLGGGKAVLHTPGSVPEELQRVLDAASQSPKTVFTDLDHIVSEDPIQYPSTAGRVESITTAPLTAILYAYGIHPDRVDQLPQKAAFYRERPNEEAVVATLPAGTGASPSPTSGTTTTAEAGRRALRDDELLLDTVVEVEKVVALPAFNEEDPWGSLDRAAEALIDAGVAISE